METDNYLDRIYVRFAIFCGRIGWLVLITIIALDGFVFILLTLTTLKWFDMFHLLATFFDELYVRFVCLTICVLLVLVSCFGYYTAFTKKRVIILMFAITTALTYSVIIIIWFVEKYCLTVLLTRLYLVKSFPRNAYMSLYKYPYKYSNTTKHIEAHLAWNKIETLFECCGFENGPEDYGYIFHQIWNSSGIKMVPCSCCGHRVTSLDDLLKPSCTLENANMVSCLEKARPLRKIYVSISVLVFIVVILLVPKKHNS